MKNKFVLFIAAFLLIGSLVFFLGRSSPKEPKESDVVQGVVSKELAETFRKDLQKSTIDAQVDVDFYNASLDSVATFVAGVTRKGIVFNAQEKVLISWMEQGVRESFLFNAFQNVLGAYNLTMRPLNPQASAFEIVRIKDIPIPIRLDYAWSSKGLFFWFNSTIYPYEKFPYPLRQSNGSWFALVPSQQVQQEAPQPSRLPSTPETAPKPASS